MKIRTLIEKLQEMENICGNVEVQTYSDEYCMSCHNINDVTDGWYDGWRDHNDVVGICIN